MHLCLVVMMVDTNYLSNKILLKQSWKVCTKQWRHQCGSITPSNTFRQSLECLWTGLWGTGCAPMHVAHGVCSDNQERLCWTPWTHLRTPRGIWEWHLGTWFRGDDGGVGLMMIWKVSANLDDSGIWWFWDSFGHFPVPECSLMVHGHWLGTLVALRHLVTSERHRIWVLSGSSIHCENNNVVSGDHQETGFTVLIQTEAWKVQPPHEILG